MAKSFRGDSAFRALLRLFPGEFRGDFGEQMAADFSDQRADAARRGTASRLWLWLRTAADLIGRAPREHLDILRRDASYAVRVLRNRPASTITIVFSLAVGIGLNVAVFSVVNGVLWRSLPFPGSERLVRLFGTDRKSQTSFLTGGDFVDLSRSAHGFTSIGAGAYTNQTIVEPGEPEALAGTMVTQGFFETLGARPILGRTFTANEYVAPAPSDAVTSIAERLRQRAAGTPFPSRPMVISHALWQRRFLGRADVIGQRVRLATGIDAEIIGVMGPELASVGPLFGRTQEWWMPRPPNAAQRGAQILDVFARLGPGQTLTAMQAELGVLGVNIAAAHPGTNKDRSFRGVFLLDSIITNVRTELRFLFGAVLCVLLVTCVNVVHVFLANAVGRRAELATRIALGATRAQLVRQTLTESAVLAVAGGAGGLLLAAWALPLLISMAPPGIPRIEDVRIDASTFAFAAAVSLGVALLCGLAASLPVAMTNPRRGLDNVRGGATRHGRRARQALAACEIAVALMLVVASMLMVRTMRTLGAIDLGFDPRGVVSAILPRPPGPLSDDDALARMHAAEAEVVDAVRQLPGVIAVGVGGSPMGLMAGVGGVTIPGDSRVFDMTSLVPAGVGYFEALGARLEAGRFFTVDDRAGAPTVAILGESTARRFWPGGNAVGQVLNLPANPNVRVVGVVADMAEFELVTKSGGIYIPHVQSSYVTAGQMLIRTTGDPDTLVPAIKSIIRRVNPETPFPGVTALQSEIDRATAPRRFILNLIGLFSALGLALAVVGIYGVIAESVAERVREIGVRMALGAQASDVVVMIVRQGLRIVTIGLALGMAGAFILRGQMTTMVFGVTTLDPWSYTLSCLALVLAAMAACAIPAQRAARLDPVIALRTE